MIIHVQYPNKQNRARELKVRTHSVVAATIKRLCLLLGEETGDGDYGNKNNWGLYFNDKMMKESDKLGQYGVKSGSLLSLKPIKRTCAVNLTRDAEVAPALVFPIFDNKRA